MLGEVIAVRSVVYLALTYDHRLIDGADAARFLATVKNRLEEGAFEAELGPVQRAGLPAVVRARVSGGLLPGWPGAGRRASGGDPNEVAITGSSGLIGTAVADSLRGDGHQVLRLARRPARPGREHRNRRRHRDRRRHGGRCPPGRGRG